MGDEFPKNKMITTREENKRGRERRNENKNTSERNQAIRERRVKWHTLDMHTERGRDKKKKKNRHTYVVSDQQ